MICVVEKENKYILFYSILIAQTMWTQSHKFCSHFYETERSGRIFWPCLKCIYRDDRVGITVYESNYMPGDIYATYAVRWAYAKCHRNKVVRSNSVIWMTDQWESRWKETPQMTNWIVAWNGSCRLFRLSRIKNKYFMFLNFSLILHEKARFYSIICPETRRSENCVFFFLVQYCSTILLGDSSIFLRLKYFYWAAKLN
jgi:hypothetical protein